jgi:hypothetical protein
VRVQDFDDHVPPEDSIEGSVDGSGTPTAEEFPDLVTSNILGEI